MNFRSAIRAAARDAIRTPRAPFRRALAGIGLALCLFASDPAAAQDPPPQLRLDGLVPVGARSTLTDSWGTFRFTVSNLGPVGREARVVVFFPESPDVQFGRDVWVPADAAVTSWLPVGPPPPLGPEGRRELSYKLFERIDGEYRPVASREPERRVTRAVPYRPRGPSTALYLDPDAGDVDELRANPDSPAAQALTLVRSFRLARGLSEAVSLVLDKHLPPTAEAFDGIDQFVLASNRIADDPAAGQALRHWVLRGGTLWVLLDQVTADTLAPILGKSLRFQTVGRTTLTSLRLRAPSDAPSATAEVREFDRPVEFQRVLLSGSETVHLETHGWPVAFSQPVGRGKVMFTTLGGRGWHRPRTPRDPPSRFENARDLPIPARAMDVLVWQLYPEPQPDAVRPDDLAAILTADIGYRIAGRGTAVAVLGGFVGAVLVLALWLRRSRVPERIGWCAPAAALAAAGVFVGLGASARRAVPTTAAAVAVVEVTPETGEAAWRGLFAVYRAESGAVDLGTESGGEVDLDQTGLDGQPRRRIQSDLAAWRWEQLSFPAGVRTGPFRATSRTGVAVAARFGPRGLEGRLTAGTFRDPVDALVRTRSGTVLTARVEPDGSFRVGPDDALPPGQYLAEAVLTDRQQRHQDVYRQLLAKAGAGDRDRLYAWATTDEIPFAVAGAERTFGTALLVVPIEYGPPAAGEPILVPGGFAPCTVEADGRSRKPNLDQSEPARMRLRFQLPASVGAARIERATLVARVRAAGRRLSVSGSADGNPVPLYNELGPDGPIRIDIADARLLRPDPTGGLLLDLDVSDRLGPDGRPVPFQVGEAAPKWTIEALGLEVAGQAAGSQ